MTTTPAREAIRDEALERLDDIRRNIIRQLGGDPHQDRIILQPTEWDIVLGALANAGAVPEGFVLVPRVPTQEMFEAFNSCPDPSFAAAYRAMLSASPSSDTGGVG